MAMRRSRISAMRMNIANHPHPDVIFLDLHLPKKSGLEVLAEIKENPKLRVTPVVVVSGSANPQEVREAYELHASCYIRKPDDLPEFPEVHPRLLRILGIRRDASAEAGTGREMN